MSIITSSNGFGYRTDDHGDTSITASSLGITGGNVVFDEGIIEQNTDLDFFSFTTTAGTINLDIDPFYRSPNLDILASLYDSTGTLIATSNPLTELDANFNLSLSAGTYYLSIDGTGNLPLDTGYSDYGSLGYYSISGTITANGANETPTVAAPVTDVTVNEDAVDTVVDLSGVFDDVEDGGSLTLTVNGNTNAGLVGTSLVGTNLTLSYTPDGNGTASIVIRATDSGGAWVEDTFTITVNAVNDTPTVATPVANVTVNEDAFDTVVDLSGVFSDIEDGAALTLSIQDNTNSGLVGTSLVGTNLTLSYTSDGNGTADITVRATDSSGAWIEDTFTVTVNAVNDTPTLATPVADITVNEDAVDTVVDLSGVFDDVEDGGSLTLTVNGNTNAGLVGTALVGTNLTLSYTPDANGTADITVRATDASGAWVEHTFTVTVNAVNDVPTVANPISDVTVNEDATDTMLDLSAVFGDLDPGDSLTLSVANNTNSGLVTTSLVGTNLTLSYTADGNGTADITVRATDASGAFVENTFTVTVNAVNDTPTVAIPVTDVTVNEDAVDTVVDLSGVFDDVEDGGSLTLTVNGNTNAGLVGTALVGTNLTLSYTPDGNGTADITVRATDASGAFVENTFTVTVNAVNDVPTVANPISDVTVNEDATVTVLDLSAVFGDLDPGDSLTLSVASNSNSGLVGTSLVGTNLTLSYAAQQSGTASIVIRATDSGGAWIEDTFTVTVNAVNDTPTVAAAITDVTVNEDAVDTVVDLSGVFDDTEDGGGLALSVASNSNSGLVGTSLVGTNLTLSYAAQQSGTTSIVIRATDSGGAWVEDTFTVTVNTVNDTPTVAAAITDVTVNEDAVDTVVDLSGVFDDVEDGGSLTLTVSSNSNAGLVGAALVGTNLTLSYTPDANGTADITVRATDAGGAWVENTFTVTVNAVNDTPTVAAAIADVTVNEDAVDTVVDLSSMFDDVEDGGSLTLSVASNSNAGLVGTSLVGTNLTLSYATQQTGTASIVIRATDSGGAWVENTFTVTVNAANDTPTVATPVTDVTVNEDAVDTVVDLSGVFDDVEDGGSLTLSVANNSNSGLVGTSLVGTNLTLSYAAQQNGTASITIRATDSGGAWIEDTFTVTVNAVNDTPTVATPVTNVTVNEDAVDTVVDLSGVFGDIEDGGSLTLTVNGNTNAGLVSTNLVGTQLTLSYTPDANGTADITVRATDSSGSWVEDTFTITVNDAPTVAAAIADVTVNEDAVDTVVDLSGVFDDIEDGGSLTLSVASNSNSGLVTTSLVGTNLTLSYAAQQSGTAGIVIRATDSGGTWVEDTFTVTVNAANDTPTVATPITDVTVNEDAADTVVDLSGVFDDVEDGGSLTLSVASNSNSGLVGTSLVGTNLTLSYTPDGSGTADITVRATDSGGAWVEDTFTVTVNAVNDTPTVATPVADVTVNEDAVDTVVDLSGVFDDVEDGGSLTLSVASNSNSGLVGTTLVGTNLTLSYTPQANGTSNIIIRATDSGGAWIEDTFTVTVNAANDTPTVATAVTDVTVNEDAVDTVVDLSGVFDDVEGGGLTLTVNGNTNAGLVGTALVGTNLTLSYTPDANGTSNIIIRATDSGGAFVENTFTVTVNAVNDTPNVTNAITDTTVDEDAVDTVLDLSAVFGDLDPGDSLTLSVANNTNPGLVTTSLVGTNLTLSYAAQQTGTAGIVIRATDSSGAWVEDTFTVTVNAVNDTPTLATPVADVTVNENAVDTVVDLSGVFNDIKDGGSLTLSVASNSNSGLVTTSLVGTNLTLSYASKQIGTAEITIRATDSEGVWVEDTFTATVQVAPKKPNPNQSYHSRRSRDALDQSLDPQESQNILDWLFVSEQPLTEFLNYDSADGAPIARAAIGLSADLLIESTLANRDVPDGDVDVAGRPAPAPEQGAPGEPGDAPDATIVDLLIESMLANRDVSDGNSDVAVLPAPALEQGTPSEPGDASDAAIDDLLANASKGAGNGNGTRTVQSAGEGVSEQEKQFELFAAKSDKPEPSSTSSNTMDQETGSHKLTIGIVAGTAITALGTYLIWFRRGGSRLASVLSAMHNSLPFRASGDKGWSPRRSKARRKARTTAKMKRNSNSHSTRT